LSTKTRLVAVTHVSNVLGTVNPAAEIVARAHQAGAVVLLDGAQAVPHMPVDVRALDVDFYVFSGHKMFGPTGIGVFYGKAALLEAMPPWQGGGDMIDRVSFSGTTYNTIPHKFEAGTPHIAGAIGLGVAADYLSGLDLSAVHDYERDLLAYAEEKLLSVPGLTIIGRAPGKASVISFTLAGAHPHDVGALLDQQGVAVRTGHHCAMPLMERFGVSATTRASLAFYNTREDIDTLHRAILKARDLLS
jgi:cysteine desulfurase/selenocysteine lyase